MPSKELEHDTFLYNKDGATLFKAGEKVPSGFVDSPAKVQAASRKSK